MFNVLGTWLSDPMWDVTLRVAEAAIELSTKYIKHWTTFNSQRTTGGRPAPLPLNREDARTVPEAFLADTQFVEHAQQKIRHRRVFGRDDMPVAFEGTSRCAQENDRQRIMVVLVSIAHAASVQN